MARPKKNTEVQEDQVMMEQTPEATPAPTKRKYTRRKTADTTATASPVENEVETEDEEVAAAPKRIGIVDPGRIYVRLFYFEPILGTWPADPEIARRFIMSKAPGAATLEDEIASMGPDAVVERALTIFNRMGDGTPHHWDFQLRGFLKAAWAANKKRPGSIASTIKGGKKLVDTEIFAYPRKIALHFDGELTYCERPLRASTPKGERVNLSNSEQAPDGTWSDVMFECLVPSDVKFVRECLNYGRYAGMGQWRNSGKGRFYWEEHAGGFDGPVIGGNFKEFYPGGYEEFKAMHPAFNWSDKG